jgi:hypothetical protein
LLTCSGLVIRLAVAAKPHRQIATLIQECSGIGMIPTCDAKDQDMFGLRSGRLFYGRRR